MRLIPSPYAPPYDVLIVGAGPAGLGCAVALKACGVENLLILERDRIGTAFERWPAQMRMITPARLHRRPRPADVITRIARVTEPGYRDACYRTFATLPKSTPWLPPGEGFAWLRAYLADPATAGRARRKAP